MLLALLVLTGCGLVPSGSAVQGSGSELSKAHLLADPKSYQGLSTAALSTPEIEPIDHPETPILPATATDSQGTTVTVTDISRILPIDLYGTSSRTVFELGLGRQVVGRDVSSNFPGIAKLPLVTRNGHELNAEAILQLAPTVIITDSSLGPWNVILQMRDAGIPVVVIDSHRSLENVGALTRQIATALGVPDDGARLAGRTTAQIADMQAAIAKVVPADGKKLRMLFLYVRGQAGIYYIFGSGSGTDSLIDALGGVDVATEIGWTGMKPVTDEALVKAKPDVVLMMTKGLQSVDGVDGLLTHVPALANTNAGQNRRVVDMADEDILSFGPNSAAVLEALAVAIYAPESANTTQARS